MFFATNVVLRLLSSLLLFVIIVPARCLPWSLPGRSTRSLTILPRRLLTRLVQHIVGRLLNRQHQFLLNMREVSNLRHLLECESSEDGRTSSAQSLWWTFEAGLSWSAMTVINYCPSVVVWVSENVYAQIGQHDCSSLVLALSIEVDVHGLAEDNPFSILLANLYFVEFFGFFVMLAVTPHPLQLVRDELCKTQAFSVYELTVCLSNGGLVASLEYLFEKACPHAFAYEDYVAHQVRQHLVLVCLAEG